MNKNELHGPPVSRIMTQCFFIFSIIKVYVASLMCSRKINSGVIQPIDLFFILEWNPDENRNEKQLIASAERQFRCFIKLSVV